MVIFSVIPTWITISTCVILYNSELVALPVSGTGSSRQSPEYIFTGLNFPYPVFLTTFHLFFAVSLCHSFVALLLSPTQAGVTRLLKRFTHLIDEADRFEMTVSD